MRQVAPSAETTPPRARLVSGVFLIVCFATFAYFLAIGALIPTLPLFIEGPLGGSSVSVGVAVGAFSLAAVVLRPLTGRLGDRRGRRILMLLGPSIVAVAIVGYVAVDSLLWLIVLRIVGGVGEAFFYVGAASAINDLAPDERRGEAVSYFSLALYGGLVVGPVVGETVLGDGQFDTAWLVAAGLSATAAVLALFMRETKPPHEKDAAPVGFVHRAVLRPGMVLAASVWGIAAFNSFIPLYALEVGLDGSRMVFVTFSGVVLLIRSLGARLPDRMGSTRAASSALVCLSIGLGIIGAWNEPTGLFVGAAIFGVGQALAFPALMSLAIGGIPPHERASAIGTFTAFFDLSFGLGAVGSGAVASLLGYRGAFGAASLVAVAGLGLLIGQVRRSARVQPAGESA